MADQTITLKLIVDDGGKLKSTSANIDKTTKSIDRQTKSKKRGTQGTNRFNKAEKGLYQTNLSASKGFSKMNQTMGGSSGLVAAYATLAANVFAATAAFSALSKAAQFEQLRIGLVELGASSGQTLSVMAKGLREVTGNAISAEEAMRGAALGISGGFQGAELEGLAKIAKGASITLGRSLPDAFDRLTRGAIKLEPEILDELGIMVRLDDAVETYAAEIGKAAGSLTQMERRQAFMNAILEQGKLKFDDIAESVDTDVYAKLGATFSDLTKDIFTFINKTLHLETVVKFLADNVLVLLGTMVLFGSTIAGKMLPALGQAGERAAATAKGLREMAEAAKAAAISSKLSLAKSIQKSGVGSPAFQKIMARYAANEVKDTKELIDAKRSLTVTLSNIKRTRKQMSAEELVAHKARIKQHTTEIAELEAIIAIEQGRGKASVIAATADIAADSATRSSEAIQLYSTGAVGLTATLGKLGKEYPKLSKDLIKQNTKLTKGTGIMYLYQVAVSKASAVTKVLGFQIKALGAAVLKALPLLGILTVVIGTIIFLRKRMTDTEAHGAFIAAQEKSLEILQNQEEISRKYMENQARITNSALKQAAAYKAMSGMIKETNNALQEEIRLREKSDVASDKDVSARAGGIEGFFRKWVTGFSQDASASKTSDILVDTMNQQAGSEGGVAEGGRAADKQRKMVGNLVADVTDQMDEAGKEGFFGKIFAIENSAEWRFFQQALKSDIPRVAEESSKAFLEIMQTEGQTNTQRLKALALAYEKMGQTLGGVGDATTGIAEGLRESEKEASKFLSSFAKKTKISELARQLEGMRLNLAVMEEQVGLSGVGGQFIEMGKALRGVGSETARLIGPQFVDAQQKVIAAEKQIADLKADGNVSDTMKNAVLMVYERNLKKAQSELGKQKPEFEKLVSLVLQIERTEMTIGQELKNIATSQKLLNGLKKSNITMAKLETDLVIRKLGAEKKLKEEQRKLLINQLAGTALMTADVKLSERMTIEEGTRASLIKIQSMTMEERHKYANAIGIDTARINSLEEMSLQIQRKEREIALATDTKSFKVSQETYTLLKKRVDEEMKMWQTKHEILKIESKLARIYSGQGTGLTASEEASFKIDASKQELENAQKVLAANLASIEAKRLEKAREAKEVFDTMTTGMTGGEAASSSFMADYTQQLSELRANADREIAKANIDVDLVAVKLKLSVAEAFDAALQDAAAGEGMSAIAAAAKLAIDPEGQEGASVTMSEGLKVMSVQMEDAKVALMELGPEGEAYAGVLTGMQGIAGGFTMIADAGDSMAQRVKGVSGILKGIGSVIMESSKAQSAEINNQIKLEENRDGKSKESLARIKALKQKQYLIEKKAFEQNKKIQLANAVVSGAAAIQNAFATPPWPLGMAMGILAIGMTAMQIKAIKNSTFGGTPPDSTAATAGAITVGKRSNRVDVAQRPNAGELAYLTGQRGIGTNANNFTAMGGAAGLRKGYAEGGVLVGERGPEMVSPTAGGLFVTANDKMGGKQINVNFTIQAIDSEGVEGVLQKQRGNIIGMIRSAANDYGEEFIESVNVDMLNYPGGYEQSPTGDHPIVQQKEFEAY